MELVNFKNIDFNKSINKELKVINFNGTDIAIVPHLNIQDKFDFVMITLQKSFCNGIYNDVKLDMYFDLHLVYMYTNIEFDAEDRADEEGLYDTMFNSGLIAAVRESIGEETIKELMELIKRTRSRLIDYKGSFISFVLDIIDTIPNKAQEALGFLNKVDPEIIKKFATGSFAPIMSGMVENLFSKDKIEQE